MCTTFLKLYEGTSVVKLKSQNSLTTPVGTPHFVFYILAEGISTFLNVALTSKPNSSK